MKKITMLLVFAIMGMMAHPVFAGPAVVITGSQDRVNAAAGFLENKGTVVEKRYGTEVMGTFEGKPWPGVNVTSDGVPGSGIFIPISNKALTKGLCLDQRNLLASFVPKCVSKTCDEGIFSGRIPAAVLRMRPAGSVAIEVHFRAGKSQPYKAKRGFVKTDGRFYPEVASDGSCMVKRSVNPLTQIDLVELLYTGDVVEQVMNGDGKMPFTDHDGSHDTIAVYVIDNNK